MSQALLARSVEEKGHLISASQSIASEMKQMANSAMAVQKEAVARHTDTEAQRAAKTKFLGLKHLGRAVGRWKHQSLASVLQRWAKNTGVESLRSMRMAYETELANVNEKLNASTQVIWSCVFYAASSLAHIPMLQAVPDDVDTAARDAIRERLTGKPDQYYATHTFKHYV